MAKNKGKAAKKPTVPPPRSKEDELEDLLNEFRARVDEPLIILFHDEVGYDDARTQLSKIAENVDVEESSGFDPSGLQNGVASSPSEVFSSSGCSSSSHIGNGGIVRGPSSHATSEPSDIGSGYLVRSASSVEADSYGISRSCEIPSPDTDVDLLEVMRKMFPKLKDHDIKDAVKKSNNDLETAVDILLNIQHLEETSQRLKGVDGFAVDGPEKTYLGAQGSQKQGNKEGKQKRAKIDQLPVKYKLKPAAPEADVDDFDESQQQATLYPSVPSAEQEYQLLLQTQQHGVNASQSFQSGRSQLRRGGLHYQAAHIYFERGQQQLQTQRQMISRCSDTFVDRQSTDGEIDLHNIPVNDGVRNALARTGLWWSELGEDRIRKAREQPLKIITGVGRHSANGSSPMYSKVGNELRKAGWKVQDGSGFYFVTGKK